MLSFFDPVFFVTQHSAQIRKKAAALLTDPRDYAQEVALFIIERQHEYDPKRGVFAAFVFGHVDKKYTRQKSDALHHAQSIDKDDTKNGNLRRKIEAVTTDDEDPPANSLKPAPQHKVPGAANLRDVADAVSGMSAREIAKRSKRSKRRVNQILKKMRDEAKTQYALNFECGEA